MNLKEIGKLLNNQKTLYYKKNNHEIAINNNCYILKKDQTIHVRKKTTNNIDSIIEENDKPQRLLDANDIAERLGLSRQNITHHIKNENYKKFPKPLFYYENNSYKKYFWSPEQFES